MFEICKYCRKKVEIKCSRSMQGHLGVCRVWKEKKKQILSLVTKQFLISEHIEKGKSLNEICSDIGLRKTDSLIKKLKEYNLPHLKYNTSKKHKQRRIELAKKTSKKKYGYEFHLTRGSKIREKLEDNLMTKYGVNSVFALDFVKEKIAKGHLEKYGCENAIASPIIREKIKQTNIIKYGVENVFQDKQIIEKIKNKKLLKPKFQNSFRSQRMFTFLYYCLKETTDLGNHIYYATLNKEYGKKFNNRYCFYDFVVSSIKFCIEYHGSYWHADPKIYTEEDIVYETKVKEIWKKDKEKNELLMNLGFEVWVIWENDFEYATDLYFYQICRRIKEIEKNKNQRRIFFESNIKSDLEKWKKYQKIY